MAAKVSIKYYLLTTRATKGELPIYLRITMDRKKAELHSGYTCIAKDWRLPTQDELKVMYQNKDQIGEFYNINYWSSIEQDNNLAWLQGFYLGLKTCSNKNVKYGVRAVRAF